MIVIITKQRRILYDVFDVFDYPSLINVGSRCMIGLARSTTVQYGEENCLQCMMAILEPILVVPLPPCLLAISRRYI